MADGLRSRIADLYAAYERSKIDCVLGGVDDRQRQAAASLGASPARTLLTVDLPVVWKQMLAADGFAFAVSLGAVPYTHLTLPTNYPV